MPVISPQGTQERTQVFMPERAQADLISRAGLVEKGVLGDVALVRAPAQLGGRDAFFEEAFDAPGVDELVHLLGLIGDLRVPLADVDDLDAGELGQLRGNSLSRERFFQARRAAGRPVFLLGFSRRCRAGRVS